MAIRSNLHTHTTLSDGRDSVSAMADKAIECGFVSLGISDHSYVDGDEGTVGPDEERYVSAVREEAERYAGKIDVFCGLEFDKFSKINRDLYDYVIGSVHIVECRGKLCQIDWGPEYVRWVRDEFFGGDVLKLCETYFRSVAEHARLNRPDIIGHYDLIALSSGVDENDPDYVEMAVGYAVETMKWCSRFEVNTGAMGRRLRKFPYPCLPVLEELCKRGGTVILSSDAHRTTKLKYGFVKVTEILKKIGFRTADRLTKDGFVADKL